VISDRGTLECPPFLSPGYTVSEMAKYMRRDQANVKYDAIAAIDEAGNATLRFVMIVSPPSLCTALDRWEVGFSCSGCIRGETNLH
jgi:hypothetical protein